MKKEKFDGKARQIDSTVHSVVSDVVHGKATDKTPDNIIGKIMKKR